MKYDKLVELVNKFKGRDPEDIRSIINNVLEATEDAGIDQATVDVPTFAGDGLTLTGTEPKSISDVLNTLLDKAPTPEEKAATEVSNKIKNAEHKMRTEALPEHQKEYAAAQERVKASPKEREQDLHQALFEGLSPEEIKKDYVKKAQDAVTVLGNAYDSEPDGHQKVADMLHKLRAAKHEGKKFFNAIDPNDVQDIVKHVPGKSVKEVLDALNKYYDNVSTEAEDINESKVNAAEAKETAALRNLKSQVSGYAKTLADEDFANKENKSTSAKRTHYKENLSPLDPLYSGGNQKDAQEKALVQNTEAWNTPGLRERLAQSLGNRQKSMMSKDEWLSILSDPETKLHIKLNQHNVDHSQVQLTVFNKDNPNGKPFDLFGKDLKDFRDAWAESGLPMPDIDFVVNERKATDATVDSSKSQKMVDRAKQWLTTGNASYLFGDPSQGSVVTRDENGFVTEYAKDKRKPTPESIKYDDSYIKHLAAMINNGDISPENIKDYITNGKPKDVPESYIDKAKREIRVNMPGGGSYSVPAPDDSKLKEQLEELKAKVPQDTKLTIEVPRIPNKDFNPMSSVYSQFKDDSQRSKALSLVKDIIGLNAALGNDYEKGQNFWGKGGLDAGSLRSLSNKFAKLRSLPGNETKSAEDLIKEMPIWIPNDKSLAGGSMFDLSDFIGNVKEHPKYKEAGRTDPETKAFTPFTLNDLYSAQFKLNQYKRNHEAPIDRQELRDFLDNEINNMKLAINNKDFREVSSDPEFNEDTANKVLEQLNLGRSYLDTKAERRAKIQQALDPRELSQLKSLADVYPEEYEAVKKRYNNDKIELNSAMKSGASFDDINTLRNQMLKSRSALEAFDQKVKVGTDADGNTTVEDMSSEELQNYLHPNWDNDDIFTAIDKDLANRELVQKLKDDTGANNIGNPNVMFNAIAGILDKLSEINGKYKGWANTVRNFKAPIAADKLAENFDIAKEELGWTPAQFNAWTANKGLWSTDKSDAARLKVNSKTSAPRLVGVDDINLTDTANRASKALQDIDYQVGMTDDKKKKIIDGIKKEKGIHSKLDDVKDQLNNLVKGILLDRPEEID